MVILIPCFNDWAALDLLLPRVARAVAAADARVSVLIVDDASTEPAPANFPASALTSIEEVRILHLRCNLSHQRAIALGLYHAHEFTDASAVVVMDADGEDCAEDVLTMLEEFKRMGGAHTIFAARTKRLEGASFQLFYQAYRFIHRILTGIEVRVGNFSVLPRSALVRLMAAPDLWNHYAAAVYRARLPRKLIPLARGRRLAGKSQMNFVSLLIHGLAAMSVFSDIIAARLLAVSALAAVTGLGIAAWSGFTAGALVLLAISFQLLLFSASFALTIVGRRSSTNFLALRDSPHYLLGTTLRWRAESIRGLGAAIEQERTWQP